MNDAELLAFHRRIVGIAPISRGERALSEHLFPGIPGIEIGPGRASGRTRRTSTSTRAGSSRRREAF